MKKLPNILGIDYHIGMTLLLRLWSILSGGLLVLFIPICLTSKEQGYYFTFSSIISAQVFFELGFNYVVVQMVSHEMVGLKYDDKNGLLGDVKHIKRIGSLINLLKKWYRIISVLFFIVISFSGYCFFLRNGSLSISSWIYTWFLLVGFAAINLYVSPFLSVLEGLGLVGKVALVRLVQSIIGYLGLFILLWSGRGLLAVPILNGSMAFISFIWIKFYHQGLFGKHNDFITGDKISWRKEIFPFQWRIALSWLSGYFIFQLFNPVIFANQGENEAGRVGLTLTIFSTMLSLSMSWISAKIPMMARLIAERNINKLNCLFRGVFIKSAIVNVLICLLFFMVIFLLKEYNVAIVERIANVNILLMLFFVSVFNHFIFSAATYMRAHKKEPMMWNSLVSGVLIALAIYESAKISSSAVIASYMVIIVFVCFPWTIYTLGFFIKVL